LRKPCIVGYWMFLCFSEYLWNIYALLYLFSYIVFVYVKKHELFDAFVVADKVSIPVKPVPSIGQTGFGCAGSQVDQTD
jgi:hypothetical protein